MFTVGHRRAQAAFDSSVAGFIAQANAFSEYDLLAASACHGWSRLDVVCHTIAGWQEMLQGLVCRTADPATVDSASFWTAFAAGEEGADEVARLLAQNRRSLSYGRPAGALAQLADVGADLRTGAAGCSDVHLQWQGQVFTAGDFLTVWAVENVIHQLDLQGELEPPADGLDLAARTVRELAGVELPSWDDRTITLVGSGRAPAPAPYADQLPVLG